MPEFQTPEGTVDAQQIAPNPNLPQSYNLQYQGVSATGRTYYFNPEGVAFTPVFGEIWPVETARAQAYLKGELQGEQIARARSGPGSQGVINPETTTTPVSTTPGPSRDWSGNPIYTQKQIDAINEQTQARFDKYQAGGDYVSPEAGYKPGQQIGTRGGQSLYYTGDTRPTIIAPTRAERIPLGGPGPVAETPTAVIVAPSRMALIEAQPGQTIKRTPEPTAASSFQRGEFFTFLSQKVGEAQEQAYKGEGTSRISSFRSTAGTIKGVALAAPLAIVGAGSLLETAIIKGKPKEAVESVGAGFVKSAGIIGVGITSPGSSKFTRAFQEAGSLYVGGKTIGKVGETTGVSKAVGEIARPITKPVSETINKAIPQPSVTTKTIIRPTSETQAEIYTQARATRFFGLQKAEATIVAKSETTQIGGKTIGEIRGIITPKGGQPQPYTQTFKSTAVEFKPTTYVSEQGTRAAIARTSKTGVPEELKQATQLFTPTRATELPAGKYYTSTGKITGGPAFKAIERELPTTQVEKLQRQQVSEFGVSKGLPPGARVYQTMAELRTTPTSKPIRLTGEAIAIPKTEPTTIFTGGTISTQATGQISRVVKTDAKLAVETKAAQITTSKLSFGGGITTPALIPRFQPRAATREETQYLTTPASFAGITTRPQTALQPKTIAYYSPRTTITTQTGISRASILMPIQQPQTAQLSRALQTPRTEFLPRTEITPRTQLTPRTEFLPIQTPKLTQATVASFAPTTPRSPISATQTFPFFPIATGLGIKLGDGYLGKRIGGKPGKTKLRPLIDLGSAIRYYTGKRSPAISASAANIKAFSRFAQMGSASFNPKTKKVSIKI